MRPLLIRRTSRSARVAQSLAGFAVVLVAFAAVAFRYRVIDPLTWLGATGFSAVIALLSLLFAALGLIALWREGAKGGIASMRAIGFAALVLGPLGYAGFVATQLPEINDVTTNPEMQIAFPLGSRTDLGPVLGEPIPVEEVIAAQREAYPDLITRFYRLPPERLVRALESAAETLGWEPLSRSGSLDQPEGQRFAYLARTLVLRFEDDVVVRFLPVDDGVIAVDVRSAGRFGRHDFGGNARRIRTFFTTFERALRNLPVDQEP